MTFHQSRFRFLTLQQEIIDAIDNQLLSENDPRLEHTADGNAISLRVGGIDGNAPSLRVFNLDSERSDCWLLVSGERFVNTYSNSATLISEMDSILHIP